MKSWKFVQYHIPSLTLKSLSQTRWESCTENVKAIRFQVSQVKDTLFKLVEVSDDPRVQNEPECLAIYELENFEFLSGMTIWYGILFAREFD